MNKKRVLFVDDEQRILDGIRRLMRSMRNEWDSEFANSSKQALEIMGKMDFNVIVTDIRMPIMDGAELLEIVREKHPNVVRIVLTGQTNKGSVLKMVSSMHQFLIKPCDAKSLKEALSRACTMKEILKGYKLTQLISHIKTLPSRPTLYFEIMKVFKSPSSSSKAVGKIIAQDMGMSAKVLQIVNSAYCGLRNKISNPTQAVVYLGMNMVRSLVLTANVFMQFEQRNLRNLQIDKLWDHSMNTGTFSKIIAMNLGSNLENIDNAFMSGVLHDVGKLILAANLPKQYGEVLEIARKENICDYEAEKKVFGSTHSEVGAYLLDLWGLPNSIVIATAFHNKPSKRKDMIKDMHPLTAVHIANVFEHEMCPENSTNPRTELDPKYLNDEVILKQLPQWRKRCEKELLHIRTNNE